jgi:hypothetical protein
MKKFIATLVFTLALVIPTRAQQIPYAGQSRLSNLFVGANFGKWQGRVAAGGSTIAGAYTITVASPYAVNSAAASFQPYYTTARLKVGVGATQETVTPTTVSGCGVSNAILTCNITATFANAHGLGTLVQSGSGGLDEALNIARTNGGGVVLVDNNTSITNANINTSTAVFPNVVIESMINGTIRPWTQTPTGLALAAPTLPAINIAGQAACDATHQMCSDATVAGSASWGGTVFACWTYVDIMGNEGPCSASTSWTSVASKAIDLGIPAASPGAVGAVPYLSLSGGSYALAYQIPVTASVCTMTTLETITPACAVANTTFGQAGSTFGAGGLFTSGGAQITTFPVNTSMVAPVLATTAVTLAAQHPMTNSSVTYAYAPSNRDGGCGFSSANMVQYSAAGGINGSSATTVPNPIASWTVPAGCFNFVGAEFRVTGKWTYTDGGDSSTHLIVAWDSNVTDTASVPTPLCDVLDTATGTAAAYNGTFTCTVRTLTTAVAAGTGGAAMVNGYATQNLAAGATTLVRNGADIAVAKSAAINLFSNARIVVWFEGIGATNNPGAQALEASLEVLN